MKKSNLILLLFVLVGLGAFLYVANKFSYGEKGVQSQKPITYCQADKCYYTAHTHMEIRVIKDGVIQDVGYEKGDLQKPHTHSERNVIHWHATLPVDSTTKQVTDYSPLKLRVVLVEMGINYEGKDVRVLVNSTVVDEGLDYIWQDGDKIQVEITENKG